jgi:hypothetical protein
MRVYPSDATPTWDVWHVRRCCVPTDVIWMDSESAKWAQFQWSPQGPEIVVHQAARIHLFPDRRLALIDPVRSVDAVIARVSRR